MRRRWASDAVAAGGLAGVGLALPACSHVPVPAAPEPVLAAAVASLGFPEDAAVMVGAGDIARCEAPEWAAATALLVETVIDLAPDALVFTTGDHAYEEGTRAEFEECYDPLWGTFNERTRPTPGNHDYRTALGAPYYDYFEFFEQHPGAVPLGYYSYEHGEWQVVALNSMLKVEPGSLQVTWLERTLAASDRDCILAYWHHPLYSSGFHGYIPWEPGRDTRAFWDVLASHGADLIVNGHDHLYERFAPLDTEGDPADPGLMEFVVGTGGGDLHPVIWQRANSLYVTNDVFGVLVLALTDDAYEWAFLGIDGVVYDRSEAPVPCTDA